MGHYGRNLLLGNGSGEDGVGGRLAGWGRAFPTRCLWGRHNGGRGQALSFRCFDTSGTRDRKAWTSETALWSGDI